MNTTYITTKVNGKKISIAEWIIKRVDAPMIVADIAAGLLEIKRETEKAILFQGTYGSFWAPKSQLIFEEA